MAFSPSAEIPSEVIKTIAQLTYQLVELRKQSCDHLCIENVAPEIFGGLLREYLDPYRNYHTKAGA